jgi:hypothetical protein
MLEKYLVMYQILLAPPKSPLKRGTLIPFPPFLRGVISNPVTVTQRVGNIAVPLHIPYAINRI